MATGVLSDTGFHSEWMENKEVESGPKMHGQLKKVLKGFLCDSESSMHFWSNKDGGIGTEFVIVALFCAVIGFESHVDSSSHCTE